MRSLPIFLALLLASEIALARPKPLLSGQSAAADSASTASTNPAGMTRFDESQYRLDVYYLDSDSTWENDFGSTGFSSSSKTTSETLVPNGALIKPLSEDWYFSFSMLGYSISDDYGDDWVGKYLITEYSLLYVSAFPSIAYKVNDKWSIAASLAGNYTSFEQKKKVNNLEPGSKDGNLEIDADGYTIGYGFSTLYEFSEHTRLGFNYQSKLEPSLDGDTDFSGLDPTTEGVFDQLGLLNASIDVDTRSPQRANIGIYHEFENRHAFTADINWIDFSNIKLAEIYVNDNQLNQSDLEYDDIWAYSAGYSFPVSDRLMLAAAGIYVPSMVDDDNRQLSLRLDKVWGVGVGAEWKWSDKLKFDATINYIEVGDSPLQSDPIDAIGGPVSGKFTDREMWILQFGVEWGPGPRASS
jgi:long-chain fatty acid transport protein